MRKLQIKTQALPKLEEFLEAEEKPQRLHGGGAVRGYILHGWAETTVDRTAGYYVLSST